MKKQAFTLVELIVVITILAILGTIGFINLQGFSSSSRDSKRISELSEIRNGLQIYQARNSLLPTPSEQSVTIGSGSTNLIIQGYAGISVLNEIRMNGDSKDPLDDNKYYTYSVNTNKTKFQLLALLENNDNLTSYIIPTTHASYESRHPYIVGNIVGIFLDETTNTPIQELVTSIDLNTDTNNYKVVFLDETLISSGTVLYTDIINKTNNSGITQNNEPEEPEPTYSCTTQPSYTNANFTVGTPNQENQIWQNTSNTNACYYECTNGYTGNQCDVAPIVGWRALDTNCEIEDITIGTQVWAGCNSTLGNGFEWLQIDSDILIGEYNGTIGSCYPNYNGIHNSSEPTCQPGHTKMASNAKANSWYSLINGNGDSEYNTIWGKLYTWSNSPSACPAGRHVPSDLEWEYAEEHLYDELNPGTSPNNCRTGDGWQCNGLGWSSASGTKSRSLANELKTPLTGYRDSNGSTFNIRGYGTNFWSSTPNPSNNTNTFRRIMFWNRSEVYRDDVNQMLGFSVRCIKN